MTDAPRHANPDRLAEDLAAYALGALPGPEAAELELHLDDCESCRERLRWLSPAVDVLPASVEQRTPPLRLRESLMSAVRAEAARPPVTGSAPAPGAPPRRWFGLGGLTLRPALGLAAAILLVAGVGAGYVIRGGGEQPEASSLTAARSLGPQSARISATLEREGDSATLHVERMPRLARDRVYEVWVQRDDTLVPRSIFVLDRSGGAEAAVPGPLEGAEAVYVTAEPRGGSREPTSPPLLKAPLQ